MKSLAAAMIVLSACAAASAQEPSASNAMPGVVQAPRLHQGHGFCDACGLVEQVTLEHRRGSTNATGAVLGGLAGGLLGSRLGKGDGKGVATVGGVVLGSLIGHAIQKRSSSQPVWVTTVRMRDGSIRTFEQEAQPDWAVGQTVRVDERGGIGV